jgi:GTPase SAR1 family protein
MDYSIKKPKIKFPKDCHGDLPPHWSETVNNLPNPDKGFCLGLVGMRNSGKTLLLYNLLSRFYKGCFDICIIFSPTAVNSDPTLSPESLGIPIGCFREHIDVELINNIMKQQEQDKEEYDKEMKRKDRKIKPEPLKRVLFVFDDCLSDNVLANRVNANDNIINKLCYRGRHASCSMIICSQYYKALPPKSRVNIPNWIFFATNNGKERKSIEEEQSGALNEKTFNMMFDHATNEQYSFFYIFYDCPDKKHRYRKNIDTILNVSEL